jgi:hypothetical protein
VANFCRCVTNFRRCVSSFYHCNATMVEITDTEPEWSNATRDERDPAIQPADTERTRSAGRAEEADAEKDSLGTPGVRSRSPGRRGRFTNCRRRLRPRRWTSGCGGRGRESRIR